MILRLVTILSIGLLGCSSTEKQQDDDPGGTGGESSGSEYEEGVSVSRPSHGGRVCAPIVQTLRLAVLSPTKGSSAKRLWREPWQVHHDQRHDREQSSSQKESSGEQGIEDW